MTLQAQPSSPAPQRLVRTLRLRAGDRGLAHRGALLLEDALRTASVPSAGRGRGVLLVRSLELGVIRRSHSPATVALAVEKRLGELATAAVPVGHPSAGSAPAVCFPDDAEPFRALALRLAQQRRADEWFWPLAAPGWSPAQPVGYALRSLLLGALRTSAGVMAAVSLVQALVEARAAAPLLSGLEEGDGPALLQAFGWESPSPLPFPSPAPETPVTSPLMEPAPAAPQWLPLLREWAWRWGAGDARTVWLASCLLAAEKPVRLSQPGPTHRARAAIELSLAWQGNPHPPARSGRDAPGLDPAARDRAAPPGSGEREAPAGPAPQVPEEEDFSAPPPLEAANSVVPDPVSRPSQGRDAPVVTDQPVEGVPPAELGVTPWPEEAQSPESQSPEESEDWTPAPALESPVPTVCGGLLFLLPLLSRMGMASQMEGNERLAELEFPIRLLHHVARRLGVPGDDPMLSSLPLASPDPEGDLEGFITPRIWQGGLYGPGALTVRRMESSGGRRVLLDGSGRLALAMWRGRVVPELRGLVGDGPLRKGIPLPWSPALEWLLDAWLVAVRRWCRRYARIGLRDLVGRPASVAATRTHVDVMLDQGGIDLRVRQAGLDLNPGWVPWLGKVVQFHYLEGEEVHVQ